MSSDGAERAARRIGEYIARCNGGEPYRESDLAAIIREETGTQCDTLWCELPKGHKETCACALPAAPDEGGKR